ncbi:MAG: glutamate synthase subunit beta [Ardenticatenaceae bacterium]|nr:glutamate synthase subunit beta [Ardenticatenaceae bacterium]MCB9443644.1 glutamate synthase subunit beta [Ardenticatenaceae bacterium]
MAKPTGFLEYQRETPGERPLTERIKDWQPIHLHLPETKLKTQAARCMDCGIPFCHTGHIINGMTSGCPINNLIPEWNDLVYQGLWREAYDRLSKTNNFPEFTGSVCPAPCEAACTLGISDPVVTIKSLEYAIIDKAFAEGWVTPDVPARRTGKKVAVIGSGPAGLACADQLNKVGHNVTVFERADRIGGLLTYGIPNMKLDKQIVRRRVDVMAAAGITFRTGVEAGQDISAYDLKWDFDAVVLATGASQPRDLVVDGRHLSGIHFAVPYLEKMTKQVLADDASRITHHASLSAAGKDVIVIGGGDTGTDCVASALRQGCRSLVQFEIMPEPPLKRPSDNPWPQWPKVYKMDYGQEEAAAVYGRDPREYAILTKKFEGDEQGNLKVVHTVEVEWKVVGENGRSRRVPVEIPGTEKVWPAQLVLLALGFLGPENPLLEQFGVKTANNQQLATRSQPPTYQTNVDGVFMAGDARRGQSLVVWAINEGRGAAREVDRWLMGETDLP